MPKLSRCLHKCPVCGTLFYDERTTTYLVYCSDSCANAKILGDTTKGGAR